MGTTFPLYDLFCDAQEKTGYLLAFGKKVDLTVAYKWPEKEILDNIQKIAVNANDEYGTRTAGNQAALRLLQPLIFSLCKLEKPYGADFRDPPPKQHLRRRKDGADLKIFPETISISTGNPAPRPPPHQQDHAIFADILGLFMAIASEPAPESATRENFFFPLLAVYAKWIMVLSNTSKVPAPAMTQVTWYVTENKIHDVFIGASTAGVPTDVKSREWIKKVWAWRFDMVALNDVRFAQDGWIWSESILHTNKDNPTGLQAKATKGGTCFGNCAESYPFLSTLKNLGSAEVARNCYGLAMMPKKTKNVDDLSARQLALYPNLYNPCANCRYLIDIWQGQKENFYLHFVDADGEPTDPRQFPDQPLPKT